MRLNAITSDPALHAIPQLKIMPEADLTPKTSMKVQARAAALVEVESPRALRDLLRLARSREWPLLMLGGGSNTIFATKYFEGVVVQLSRRAFGRADYLGDNLLRVGAGRQLTSLIKFAHRNDLMGLEFCHKIPGVVGGALAGNAGAGGWGLCDYVESVIVMTRSGRVIEIGRGDFRYGYRYSELSEGIVIEADLRLERLHEAVALQRLQDFEAKKKNQPYHLPSSGCIFKNPRDPRTGEKVPAGKLIDEAGLKGYTLHSAAVSDGHANFIINTGAASGEDFLALINLVKDVVQDKSGFELQVEARVVGGPLTSCVLA